MFKGSIKCNVENTNEEVKGKNSEEQEVKIPKCSRKSHVETVNEEMRESRSEEEEIGIRSCRIRSRVGIMNKEVNGWTSSSKKQEATLKITKTKEKIRLELMKRKVKREALEWDGFVFQEQLKSLIYIDRS